MEQQSDGHQDKEVPTATADVPHQMLSAVSLSRLAAPTPPEAVRSLAQEA
jgi:hypothetical protein